MNHKSELFSSFLDYLGISEEEFADIDLSALCGEGSIFGTGFTPFDDLYTLKSEMVLCYTEGDRKPSLQRVHAELYDRKKGRIESSCTFNHPEVPQFSLKEMYNLLQGRFVYKSGKHADGRMLDLWYHLIPTNDHIPIIYKPSARNYPFFQLDERLATYPIEGYENEIFRNSLLMALEKGDAVIVPLKKKNKTEKKLIHADPLNNTVVISAL